MKAMLLLGCLILFSKGGSSQKICRIIIRYVDKDISTPYRISCSGFDASFSKVYKERVVKSDKVLSEFNRLLKNVSYFDKSEEIDVRTKVIVEYQKSKLVRTLCVDAFDDILINGRLIKPSAGLSKLISELSK
jgi:hypothetical protein